MNFKSILIGFTIFIVSIVQSIPPPGYKKQLQKPDLNPPKYEYSYQITNDKGDFQGKKEIRDGIYALGRYYVKNPNSSHKVDYLADDWGYHPYVEYSNNGPHSKTSAQIVLGKESIIAEQKNRENNIFKSEKTPISNIIDVDKDNNQDEKLFFNNNNNHSNTKQQEEFNQQPEFKQQNEEFNQQKEEFNHQQPEFNQHQEQLYQQPEKLYQQLPQQQLIQEIQEQKQQQEQQQQQQQEQQQQQQPPPVILVDQNVLFKDVQIPVESLNKIFFLQPQEGNKEKNDGKIIGDFPVALPLIKEPELSSSTSIEDVSNSQLSNSNQGLDKIENSIEIKETSALFENGAEISEYLGSFGQKINPQNSKSKLIESTKDLISEIDVLNINRAENFVDNSSYLVTTEKSLSLSNNPIIVEDLNFDFNVDLNVDLKSDSKSHLQSDFNTNLKSNLNTNLKPNLESVLKTNLESNLKSDFKSNLESNLESDLKYNLKPDLESDLNSDLKSNLKYDLISNDKEINEDKIKEGEVLRPGSKFLAPITAGVQLQNVENQLGKKVLVEIQKSIPYYVGKYEYYKKNEKEEENSALDHYKLGESLINFPVKQQEFEIEPGKYFGRNEKDNFKVLPILSHQENHQNQKVQIQNYQNHQNYQNQIENQQNQIENHQNQIENQLNQVQNQIGNQQNQIQNQKIKNHQSQIQNHQNQIENQQNQIHNHQNQHQQIQSQSYNIQHYQLPLYVYQSNEKPISSSSAQPEKVKQYYYSKPFVYLNTYERNHPNLKVNYQPVKSDNLWNLEGVRCKVVDRNRYPIGLVPPKNYQQSSNYVLYDRSKKRQAKRAFESSPRLEYGFLPPLVPSQEIDELGRPIVIR